MNRPQLVALPLVALLGLASAGPAVAQRSAAEPITAFVDVTVIPMDRERVLAGQTVVVRGQRIAAMGPVGEVAVPAGAVRIDARGKFLIPGLADMHVHLKMVRESSEEDGGGGLQRADASSETETATDQDSLVANHLFFFVANGVTTVRDMWSNPGHVQLREQVAQGEVLGPRIYTANRADECGPGMSACVTEMKAAGYDFVKIEADGALSTDSALFDTVTATAREVGLREVGHVPRDLGLRRALHAPYASLEHLLGYFEALVGASGWDAQNLQTIDTTLADTAVWMRPGYRLDAAKLRALAEATRQAGSWNTPTLVILERVVEAYGPESAKRQALLRRWFELDQEVVRALRDAGAGLLLGTDMYGPGMVPAQGFLVHRELELLVAAGLTPYEALATATRNAAEFLGTLDSMGTVAVGKRADLVLLSGNPLADIRSTAGPAGVMIGGRWLARAEIDARLEAIERDNPSLKKMHQDTWRVP